MIAIFTTAGTSISNFKRKVKALLFGKDDVREASESMPWGYDGNPISNVNGVYCNTTTVGSPVVIGYINNKQKAETGESRIFATDNSGAFKYNVWLRNDGTVLIGDSDNPSAYTNNLIKWTEFNSVIQAYLTSQNSAITTAISSLGGAYVAPPAPNFTSSKTTKIKVN